MEFSINLHLIHNDTATFEQRLRFSELEFFFNTNSVELKDYGSGVSNIHFTYVLLADASKYNTFIEYNAETKTIKGQSLLHENSLEYDEIRFVRLLELVFFEALENLGSVPNFDLDRYCMELKELTEMHLFGRVLEREGDELKIS